jgi:hypothetical protein
MAEMPLIERTRCLLKSDSDPSVLSKFPENDNASPAENLNHLIIPRKLMSKSNLHCNANDMLLNTEHGQISCKKILTEQAAPIKQIKQYKRRGSVMVQNSFTINSYK